jgi:hypothetical protein
MRPISNPSSEFLPSPPILHPTLLRRRRAAAAASSSSLLPPRKSCAAALPLLRFRRQNQRALQKNVRISPPREFAPPSAQACVVAPQRCFSAPSRSPSPPPPPPNASRLPPTPPSAAAATSPCRVCRTRAPCPKASTRFTGTTPASCSTASRSRCARQTPAQNSRDFCARLQRLSPTLPPHAHTGLLPLLRRLVAHLPRCSPPNITTINPLQSKTSTPPLPPSHTLPHP